MTPLRTLLAALFIAGAVPSVTHAGEAPALVPYRKGALWGYADRSRKIVVEPQYALASLFLDAIAGVRTGTGKIIFLNATGQRVGGEYDAAGDFSDGFCQVVKNGLHGYIDSEGREKIPPKFKETRAFLEGLAAVREDVKWGVIDASGTYVIPPTFESVGQGFQGGLLPVKLAGREYLVDRKGVELKLPAHMRLLDAFREGLAVAEITLEKSNPQYAGIARADSTAPIKVHGFVDPAGQVVIGPFPDGHAVVHGLSDGVFTIQTDSKDVFFVTRAGKRSKAFRTSRPFAEGRAIGGRPGGPFASLGGAEYFLVDGDFAEIPVQTTLSDAGMFSDGLMLLKAPNGAKIGYLDRTGKMAIDYKYASGGDFKNGIAIVQSNGKPGCIDKTGREFWED